MRKYICFNNTILALFLLTLTSCEPIFIPDPIDPRLPKYTEYGYNTAGAFVNQEVWKSLAELHFNSISYQPNMYVYKNNDSLVLSLEGQIKKGGNGLPDTYIKFHLRDLNIHSFSDLKTLKNKIIQLDGVRNYGSYARYDNSSNIPTCSGTAGMGQIYFRNVSVGDTLNGLVLSGTFGFKIKNSDCGTVDVSYGRFDYRFWKNSVYWLQ